MIRETAQAGLRRSPLLSPGKVSPGWGRLMVFVFTVLSVGLAPQGWALAQSPGDSDAAGGFRFLQIATGPTGGTYFPIGGLIGSVISFPPGARPCDKGGSCGVPGVMAVAQSTGGSVANIDAIAQGRVDLALAQADLSHWAYNGTGRYKNSGAVTNLRGIAFLYQENMHLVVRKDSGIASPGDLKGKRVALGEEGSGTRVDALLVLNAYGVRASDVDAKDLRLGPAADALLHGTLDALFFVSAPPVAALERLSESDDIALVPLQGKVARQLTEKYPFMVAGLIPAGVYAGVPETPTLSVGALLVCSASLPDQLVYDITRALFNAKNRALLTRGHRAGKQIRLATAMTGMSIPLHPGAARYYFDAGLEEQPTADTRN